MDYENIILKSENNVSRITINRPPLNILDIKTMSEMISALQEIRNKNTVKAVVLTGAGTNCFSAGVEVRDHLPEKVEEMLRVFHGIFREMIKLDQPTIAVVNGYALGVVGQFEKMERRRLCFAFGIITRSASNGRPMRSGRH